MATLLHIDSSLNGDASVSREVTRTFREAWEELHPGGTVIYRDLAADPLPHLSGLAYHAQSVPDAEQTPEQRAAFAPRLEVAAEVERADAVLIGAPLYNFSLPSTLKTWLDYLIMVGRNAYVENSPLAGKRVTVVTSRGGSYAKGTPQEGNDYLHPYLEYLLGGALGMSVEFIVPELTLARIVPAMSGLIEQADASRAQAHEDARSRAKALLAELGAA
ncbi:NAD(P)H-dependent oxidoreductase [Streptomyces sp. DSM 44917]|uniref:FMN dependent NADH:quinone oxidoreductase n=1 Tax=Streptomyces boetiae TaxID=3075541 RepID=A0ABU2L6B7_9ACTN|nr:NAD(P)H-dependent oxidoreductase [Streptomyces sp. DSM 44917]MDT0307089.1 NAD(P)H-dependent oxidoreductase [Streptomyces sp. DSM 44917]